MKVRGGQASVVHKRNSHPRATGGVNHGVSLDSMGRESQDPCLPDQEPEEEEKEDDRADAPYFS